MTIEVTDNMCTEARVAEVRADYLQGFHYGKFFVIRDVLRPGPEQEIWRGPDSDRGTFEMMLSREKMRIRSNRRFGGCVRER